MAQQSKASFKAQKDVSYANNTSELIKALTHRVTLEDLVDSVPFLNADDTLTGSVTFSNPLTVATPTSGSHAVTKDYVDGLVQGLDWQESVLDKFDPTSATPSSPSTGDRYISTATANGWTDKYIYEYNSSSWDETIPNEGAATWVEDEDSLYVYNGTTWAEFGSTTTHNNLSSLQGGTSGEYYHLTSAEYSALIPDTRTLTISGTTNEIAVTGGTQDLSGNRTWTIGLPDEIVMAGNDFTFGENSNEPTKIKAYSNRSGVNDAITQMEAYWDNTRVGLIQMSSGNDTTNKDDGRIRIYTANGGVMSEVLNMNENQNATFSNNVTADDFILSSDIRKKEIIEELGGTDIEWISFYKKSDKEEDRRLRHGAKAQQVQQILPSAVIEGEDGFLKLSYTDLFAWKIAQLENKIAQLEAQRS